MHDQEKSGSAIVAVKSPNKTGFPVAEAMERRAGTKGNADRQSTHRTQIRARVTQALGRLRQPISASPSTPKVGEAMGRAAEVVATSSSIRTGGGCPVAQVNDLSRSLTAFDPISTLGQCVEMSKARWLMSGAVA